ncbi:MAG: HAD hydrolase-like protein [Candidatus Marinimicrobia bacterium]|nr:HAD hydrolase-like protein [Candidatus Neomarinimicrobiota bacterium]
MISNELKSKAGKIKLVVTDIDGVWTDAKMYYTGTGEFMKAFSTYDGIATSLLSEAGIPTAIITGEKSPAVAARAKKLKLKDVFLGIDDKLTVFEILLDKYKLTPDQVAYIGDDVNDYTVMQVAGLTASPSSSPAFHLLKPDILLDRVGGDGAFREFADIILASQDQ